MKVLRKMVLSLAALTCVSGLASAAPIVVYNKPIDEFQTVKASFDVDAKLGRAWITIEQFDTEFQPMRESVQEKVDGLSYDAASRAVLYQAPGEASVVCAKEISELGQKRYNPTANCPLQVSYEKRTVDDGTRPTKTTFAKVTLNPTTGSAQH